jgi:hypothetical protein
MKVYLLEHYYEVVFNGKIFFETKTIGIYSTRDKADQVIKRFINITGFNKYPITCFNIDEYEIDKDNWTEGFIGSDEIEGNFNILKSCFDEWIVQNAIIIQEDDEYYYALCDIFEKIYNVKDENELLDIIKFIWNKRFNNPISEKKINKEFILKIYRSLKLD